MGHYTRAKPKWDKPWRDEPRQDETHQAGWLLYDNFWCITIKMGHFTNNTSKNSVLYFCFVALCGYLEMMWCWEGGDFVMKMATVVMPGE